MHGQACEAPPHRDASSRRYATTSVMACKPRPGLTANHRVAVLGLSQVNNIYLPEDMAATGYPRKFWNGREAFTAVVFRVRLPKRGF